MMFIVLSTVFFVNLFNAEVEKISQCKYREDVSLSLCVRELCVLWFCVMVLITKVPWMRGNPRSFFRELLQLLN